MFGTVTSEELGRSGFLTEGTPPMLATVQLTDPTHPLPIPEAPEGESWQYVLVHDGDQVSFALTATALVAVMIAGYESLGESDRDHDQALLRRYDHLLMLAEYYQGEAVEQARQQGVLAGADETTLTALYSERTVPFEGGTWSVPVRLILFATDYAPYTQRPVPQGAHVLLLDPATEVNYLASLHDLGFVAFWRRAVSAVAGDPVVGERDDDVQETSHAG